MKCYSCGLQREDVREVQTCSIGRRPVLVPVCSECFGRYHGAELSTADGWAPPRLASQAGHLGVPARPAHT